MISAEPRLAAQGLATLTRRERQVLNALTRDLSNKLTAFELDISIRTVEVDGVWVQLWLNLSSGPPAQDRQTPSLTANPCCG